MRLKLKIEILASGRSQRQVAEACEIPENRFSAIVRGWTEPRDHSLHVLAASAVTPPAMDHPVVGSSQSRLPKNERDRRNAHHHENQRQFHRRANEDAQPGPEAGTSSIVWQTALREFQDDRTF